MIDWGATGAMLSGIGGLAAAAAIVAAAFLGRAAVSDYRAQKQVEREIEHAEKALAAAYQLETALSAIRSPMTTGTELQESRSELEKTDWFSGIPKDRQDRLVQTNVFYQRIRHFSDEFDEAIATMPFVKAYFGPEAGKALNDLIRARHSVRVYADAYADDPAGDPEFQKTIRSYIWEGHSPGEGDPIKAAVSEAIGVLDDRLLSVMRSEKKNKRLKFSKVRNA